MNDLTFALFFYGIPLLLLYCRWVRNYFRYEKKLNTALIQSKRISIEKVEQTISFYSNKVNLLDQKLYRESGIIKKIEENDIDFIFWEKEYLKSLGKFSDEDWEPSAWRTKWDCFYIKQKKNRELNFKKLFYPD